MKLSDRFLKNVKSYLKVIKADRTALLILSSIIFILILINIIVKKVNRNQATPSDIEKFENALAQIEQKKTAEKIDKKLFAFNPNTISKDTLKLLNLPNFIKNNLLKYRKAGGRIKSKADFKKLYGVNDSIFHEVEPFLVIEHKLNKYNHPKQTKQLVTEHFQKLRYEEKKQHNVQSNDEKVILLVELNSATEEELKSIWGIGTVFSKRIVKYRNLLGGYYKKQQLLEVYGINDSIYNIIHQYVDVDTGKVQKIRLNFAEYKTLLRHPYLNKNEVVAILDYKNKKGAYKNEEQLVNDSILSLKTYQKIRPYLTVN